MEDSWMWFFKPSTGNLYLKTNKSWRVFKRVSRAGRLGRYPLYQMEGPTIGAPSAVKKAKVKTVNNNQVILQGWADYSDDAHTWEELATSIWKLDDMGISLDMIINGDNEEVQQQIIQSIHEGTLHTVSDGSYVEEIGKGTAAFVMENNTQEFYIDGSLISPGIPKMQNSHRSELVGILGILLYLFKLQIKHGITNGNINIGCDGKSAIDTIASTEWGRLKCRMKNFDIAHAIKKLMKQCNFCVTLGHVKGHQDDDKVTKT